MSTELTIVIPTYNERDNINNLFVAISRLFNEDCKWEIIFVDDDSPDGTSDLARELANKDPRVRCLQRIGRRGLSSACIEGVLSSSSPKVCIMDADLQHDENLLPLMLSKMKSDNPELIIASRYVKEGSTGELPEHRVWKSKVATYIANLFLQQKISDPMSGFFMFRRSFFESVMHKLSGKGFKILLDMLITSRREIKIIELPYVMRKRETGVSKLNYAVVLDFFTLLIDKILGRIFPLRFVLFAVVGLSGVFVHLSVLWLLHVFFEEQFIHSQIISTFIAMTSNYYLNNYLTYYDKKLSGVDNTKGLLSFYVACSLGAVINIAIADYLYEYKFSWWLAGFFGAVSGAVWNYSSTAVFTWGGKWKKQ